jgi:hypothetical protein
MGGRPRVSESDARPFRITATLHPGGPHVLMAYPRDAVRDLTAIRYVRAGLVGPAVGVWIPLATARRSGSGRWRAAPARRLRTT